MNKKLRMWKRAFPSTTGMPLCDLRQLYTTHLRPIIGYACEAWFVHCAYTHHHAWGGSKPLKYGLQKGMLSALTKLQYNCLLQVAGARPTTSSRFLERELHVEDIGVWLSGRAAAARGMIVRKQSQYHSLWSELQRDSSLDPKRSNPYPKLERCCETLFVDKLMVELSKKLGTAVDELKVKELTAKELTQTRRRLKKLVCKKNEDEMALIWKQFQEQKQAEGLAKAQDGRPSMVEGAPMVDRPPLMVGYRGDWGKEYLMRHKGLTRAQSTILVHLRSGKIGLNQHLASLNVCCLPLSFFTLRESQLTRNNRK